VAADESEEAKKTERVAGELRELILSGEWEDDFIVPRERDLTAEHGVSLVTLRRALDALVGEGLIKKSQGKRSRVTNRAPAYRLVVKLHQTQAGHPTDRVAEPPMSFLRGLETGTEQREWSQGTVEVPGRFAALLDLERGVTMIERVMTLIVNGEPILTSTSYLPVDLSDDGEGWQDAEIGQLALIGHAVTSKFMEEQSRMPTPTERTTLGMAKGVLVKIISHPCQVTMADRTVATGVIVLARNDRVRLRWYGPEPRSWPPE
jgi:GntR family transcriptional regulator